MKTLVTIGCLLVYLLSIAACGEDDSSSEKTPVRIAFAPSAMQGEEPYTLTVTVTGEGMKEMKSETAFTGKQARVEFPAIPSGPDRVFTVEVKDKNGIVLYTGKTTQNLTPGISVTISIPTNRILVPVTIKVTPAEIQQGKSYTLTVAVTGPLMEKIEAKTNFTGKSASINLDVPSGSNRTFTVEITDKNRIVLYTGETTQSLVPGTQTTVSIPIIRIQQEVIEITGKDGAKMALIPAGEFSMGDHFNEGGSDEKPVHTVYLDAYYIDVYEVTNAQYAKFLNEYGKNTDPAGHELLDINSSSCLIEKVGNTYKPKSGYENHPVVEVTWYGAAAYAQYYGKRLPTEAEWEKAARGGLVGKRYPCGDNITHDDANYRGTGGKDKWDKTSPVGSFAPNGYGLYDMAGNVCEWCADEDALDYYSKSPKNNPKGPGIGITFTNNDFTNVNIGRVLRGGGSWSHGTYFLRCACRGRSYAYIAYHLNGFRCSQDL